MPSKTFLRLPKEKQSKLLEAAQQEFVEHPFEQAKVTSICTKAGIPRVTFYSYFESLHDIYTYLFNQLKCDTSQPQNFSNCAAGFSSLEQQMAFFINLVRSRKGMREMISMMNQESEHTRLTWNLCIALALQYDVGSITLEQLHDEYLQLSQLFEVKE